MTDRPAIIETVGGQLAFADAIDVNLEQLKATRHDLKLLKERLTDALNNDIAYSGLKAAVKDNQALLKKAKLKIEEENQGLIESIEEKKAEVKDLNESLDAKCLAYWEETKDTSVKLRNNGDHQIFIKTKLKRA